MSIPTTTGDGILDSIGTSWLLLLLNAASHQRLAQLGKQPVHPISGHSRGHETSGADAPYLPFANTVRIGSVGYAPDGHSENPTSRRYGVALKTAMPLPAEFGLKIKLWLALAVKAATEWPQQPGWLRTWIALPGLLLTTPNFPPGVLTYQALEPGSNQI